MVEGEHPHFLAGQPGGEFVRAPFAQGGADRRWRSWRACSSPRSCSSLFAATTSTRWAALARLLRVSARPRRPRTPPAGTAGERAHRGVGSELDLDGAANIPGPARPHRPDDCTPDHRRSAGTIDGIPVQTGPIAEASPGTRPTVSTMRPARPGLEATADGIKWTFNRWSTLVAAPGVVEEVEEFFLVRRSRRRRSGYRGQHQRMKAGWRHRDSTRRYGREPGGQHASHGGAESLRLGSE